MQAYHSVGQNVPCVVERPAKPRKPTNPANKPAKVYAGRFTYMRFRLSVKAVGKQVTPRAYIRVLLIKMALWSILRLTEPLRARINRLALCTHRL